MTYTPIASITLGSSASSVTFSSIPQDYRDLVLVVNGTTISGPDKTYGIEINAETSVYSYVIMAAIPSVFSDALSPTDFRPHYVSNGIDIQQYWQILDYSQTDKHKPILARLDSPLTGGASTTRTGAVAARYASTSAITSLEWYGTGSLATGATLALYGIEA